MKGKILDMSFLSKYVQPNQSLNVGDIVDIRDYDEDVYIVDHPSLDPNYCGVCIAKYRNHIEILEDKEEKDNESKSN